MVRVIIHYPDAHGKVRQFFQNVDGIIQPGKVASPTLRIILRQRHFVI